MALYNSGSVVNPWVTTNKSVDCSTIDNIVNSVIRESNTDEEKVLSLFHWVRRVLYHGDGRCKELDYNLHFLINTSGHGSCLRQTTLLAILLDRLGYRTRGWVRNGHHLMEVRYGGEWHCMDPHMNFYVYDRSASRKIASVEQLQNDPTLASDAVKEGRAGLGYLLCEDSPEVFGGPGGWVYEGEFPEGFAKPIITEPFGNITLRPGEKYILTWKPGEYWYQKNCWMDDSGPYHTCEIKDEHDAVNWPLYQPHGWKVNKSVAYRHWGTGKLTYSPNLKDLIDMGEIVLSVNCPYVITAGELRLYTNGKGSIDVSVRASNEEEWKPVASGLEGEFSKAIFVEEVNGNFDGYQIKLNLYDNVQITKVELTSHFQLNPYSLPYLVPGKNIVNVNAKEFGSPLNVNYKWSEGEEWKELKSASKEFHKDGSMEILVGEGRYPRMEALILSVAP